MTYSRFYALSIPALTAVALFAAFIILLETKPHEPTYEKKDGRVTRYEQLHGDGQGTVWGRAGTSLVEAVAGLRAAVAPSMDWMLFDLWFYIVGGYAALALSLTYAAWPHRDTAPIDAVNLGMLYLLAGTLACWIAILVDTETWFWLCCDAMIHIANRFGWGYYQTNVIVLMIVYPITVLSASITGIVRHYRFRSSVPSPTTPS